MKKNKGNVYLKARKIVLNVSATDAKWERRKYEKKFTYCIDPKFETSNAAGEDLPTQPCSAKVFDVMNNGTCQQVVPHDAELFRSANQALQVAYENDYLLTEAKERNRVLTLPFTNRPGKKFVALIFLFDGELWVLLKTFDDPTALFKKNRHIVILPNQ
jgi:hypothetical protein